MRRCSSKVKLTTLLSVTLLSLQIHANAQSSNSNFLTQNDSHHLGSNYINGTVQRYYSAGADANTFLTPDLFPFTNLQSPLYSQIYYSLPLLRQTIAKDGAIAAFWNAPGFGTSFQNAVSSAILYSPLPHGVMTGISPVNSVTNNFAPIRAKRRFAKLTSKITSVNPPQAAAVATKQAGLVGQIQNLAANSQKVKNKTNKNVVLLARAGMPEDFTMIVSKSPNNNQEYLYVVGKLPTYINPDSPTNYILLADQYNGSVDQAGNELPINQTVLDRQNLPLATDQQKYYCFVYSLSNLQPSVENNLIASYWSGKDLAVRQDIALANEKGGKTAAIPMLRVTRYLRNNLSYAVLLRTPIGGSISDTYLKVVRSRYKVKPKK